MQIEVGVEEQQATIFRAGASSLLGKRILIVDPSGPHRRNLTAVLSAEGFDCSVATDGIEALAKAIYERPHLILVDPDIRGLNGPALCQALKADSVTAHIAVVFMSSRYTMENLQAAIDSGAMDYLQIPLDSKLLLSRLLRYTSEQYVTGQTVFLMADHHPVPLTTTVVRHDQSKVYVESPAGGDLPALFNPGTHLEISHPSDDFNVYRRRAVLARHLDEGSAQIELHLATGVYRTQRKLAYRKDLHIPARYKTDGGFFRLATITEVSGSGFRMTGLHDSLDIGTRLHLEFKIPNRAISVLGEVAWRHADKGQVAAGVKPLEDADPAWRLELTRYLFRDLIQPVVDAIPASS